jgi:FkbM family methyltransferase
MIDFSVVGPDTFAGKVVRFPFRFLPRGMTVPILQGPLRGKKWILGSQRHAFWLGGYETRMQTRMARELKKGGTFYDIGANVGFYTLLGSFCVAPASVFAFEPLPVNVEFLKRHLSINHVQNVQVLQLAISDQTGTARFRSEPTGAMGQLDSCGDVDVNMSTIDNLLALREIPPPDCIKMDIEGAECKALIGARECFQLHKPVLFLATHGKDIHDRCCDLLESWKYKVEIITKEVDDRSDIIAKPIK